MPPASELLHLTPSLVLWQAYDPAVKSDLFSTAHKTAAGLFLIDPIPLAPSPLQELTGSTPVAGVLVTNANHLRASPTFARQFEAPIFAAPVVAGELESARAISDGEEISPGVAAIALPGAAPGEVAFHFTQDGGTLVVGDSLINFEPYGFTLLPAKYCGDQKEMRRSLRRLLDFDFQRLLFAHGSPILASAHERLAALLR
jgi:glyoxylase-like metal-dependent hydrolase (beta-lactamase superfamily II)